MDKSTATKSRPIIMTGESVRAILDGSKTMTRRIVKPQPVGIVRCGWKLKLGTAYISIRKVWRKTKRGDVEICPFREYQELWVKEKCLRSGDEFIYADDEYYDNCYPVKDGKMNLWRVVSPIFMPRWASRLTLRITGVRVERLHAITEADARAEGCANVAEFRERWEQINGNWRENCWVWVVEFRKVDREDDR